MRRFSRNGGVLDSFVQHGRLTFAPRPPKMITLT
jgi:hypothetical protein